MTNNTGLYLHIPFCESKCRYCDFYSMILGAEAKRDYTKALCREIIKWGGKLNRPISSLYIGGGTPSALGSEMLCEIINTAKENFSISDGAEITVEVNPKTSSGELFCALKKAGVNRLSMGVQSGNDDELAFLGRRHTADVAKQAFLEARKAGFDNISLDLMIGLPGSDKKSLESSLEFLTELNPEHISAYILKLEENTPLYKIRDTLLMPDEDEISRQYLYTCEFLKSRDYEHYEISNFSKKDRHSRHNTNYWLCGEYLGLGPCAHSFLNGERFYYPADISSFIKGAEPISDGQGGDVFEYIMLRLRLSSGVNLKELESKYNVSLKASFLNKISLFEKGGLIYKHGDTVLLTEKGMLVSNEIITELECSL